MAYTVGHMGLGVLVNLTKLLLTLYGALVVFGVFVPTETRRLRDSGFGSRSVRLLSSRHGSLVSRCL